MSGDHFAHNPSTLLHIANDLRSRGIPPVEIFRRAGVAPSALLDADGWVPRDLCFALGDAAGAIVGDPFFASRVGRSYRLEEFGTWGQTIGGAASVGEACTVAINGLGLLHQGSYLHRVDAGHTELRFGYHGRLGADPHQHIIGSLAVLRKIALLAGVPEAVGVRFRMPYARGSDCLEETHGARLEFGCDHNAIVIDRAILDLPLETGAAGRAGGTLEPAETAQAVGASVRRLLPYGRANIQTVAALQGVSTRAVQRRLREWGFSFEEILDDIRRTEAIRHVAAGQHSLIEIAFLLGYSDPAHFTRAFRRWTEMSPRAFFRSRAAVASGAR